MSRYDVSFGLKGWFTSWGLNVPLGWVVQRPLWSFNIVFWKLPVASEWYSSFSLWDDGLTWLIFSGWFETTGQAPFHTPNGSMPRLITIPYIPICIIYMRWKNRQFSDRQGMVIPKSSGEYPYDPGGLTDLLIFLSSDAPTLEESTFVMVKPAFFWAHHHFSSVNNNSWCTIPLFILGEPPEKSPHFWWLNHLLLMRFPRIVTCFPGHVLPAQQAGELWGRSQRTGQEAPWITGSSGIPGDFTNHGGFPRVSPARREGFSTKKPSK